MEKKRGVEAEVLVCLYWRGVAGVGGATVGLRRELAVDSRSVSLAWRGGKKRGSERGGVEDVCLEGERTSYR
jgi:hypothetical protein